MLYEVITDLKAGGGEEGVALIPTGAGQLRQGGGGLMDGVAAQMGIGHSYNFV